MVLKDRLSLAGDPTEIVAEYNVRGRYGWPPPIANASTIEHLILLQYLHDRSVCRGQSSCGPGRSKRRVIQ